MNYKQITDNFRNELDLSAKGEKTSLAYIKNFLSKTALVRMGERFQIFVVGGTNFRRAIGMKTDSGLQIEDIQSVEQPSFRTQEKLFSFLMKQTLPKIQHIALNFAYPITPRAIQRHLDATLVAGTKENVFDGLVGNLIGESYTAYLYEQKRQRVTVSVANDTVCLLLSGTEKYNAATLAGGVLGTGFNLAFFSDEKTIINLESGNFDKFSQTQSGEYIDAHSQTKGRQRFEKEVSGAYLFAHFNYELQQKLDRFQPIGGTDELDRIVAEVRPHADLAKEILTRSASLAACQIAGLMEFRKKSLTFVMQGSLFLKGQGYRETVKKVCHELSPTYTPTFVHIKDADLLGAAKLIC